MWCKRACNAFCGHVFIYFFLLNSLRFLWFLCALVLPCIIQEMSKKAFFSISPIFPNHSPFLCIFFQHLFFPFLSNSKKNWTDNAIVNINIIVVISKASSPATTHANYHHPHHLYSLHIKNPSSSDILEIIACTRITHCTHIPTHSFTSIHFLFLSGWHCREKTFPFFQVEYFLAPYHQAVSSTYVVSMIKGGGVIRHSFAIKTHAYEFYPRILIHQPSMHASSFGVTAAAAAAWHSKLNKRDRLMMMMGFSRYSM